MVWSRARVPSPHRQGADRQSANRGARLADSPKDRARSVCSWQCVLALRPCMCSAWAFLWPVAKRRSVRVLYAVPGRCLSQSGGALHDPAPGSPVLHFMPWLHGTSDQDDWKMPSARLIRLKVAIKRGQRDRNARKCLRVGQKMLRTNNSADVLGKMTFTKPLYRGLSKQPPVPRGSGRLLVDPR